MRKVITDGFALLTVASLLSCTFPQSPPARPSYNLIGQNNEGIPATNPGTYIVDVGKGKKGAAFSVEIKLPAGDAGFRTAANSSGSANAIADIQTYEVWLLKNDNTSSYPLNGDPLGDRVSPSFLLSPGISNGTIVAFINVPSSGTGAYYAAVKLKDSSNSDLIKPNNGSSTAWTGTTAATPAVAVSSGAGIRVFESLAVSSTFSLPVVPNLLDAVGAVLQADIAPNPGTSAPAPSLSAVFPPIGEFKVNTTTFSDQKLPAAAIDSAGDFVIAWNGNGSGDGDGIFAQRLNGGTTLGNEFRVNTTISFSQSNPSAAMDSDGDFVISWNGNGTGDSNGVFAQRYNKSGIALGSEFRVNTTIGNNTNARTNPSVAMDSTGNFVVAWQSNSQDGNSYGVYAQRYNVAGVVQGGEFRVNTTTSNAQSNPSAAMDSSGNFVVAWQSNSQDGSGYGVYAQRYNSAGAVQGGEFRVNSTISFAQRNPSAAMDRAGDFVISWNGNGSGDYSGVYAQRYNSAGVVQGGEFRVNTSVSTGTNARTNPSAAMDSTGDFVISWQSNSQDGSGYGVYAQRYNSAGAVQGVEFKVNTYTTLDQRFPAAVMDSAGEFVISWQSNLQDGGNYGIYGQRYNASGSTR
jgi:hypothetical protein